MAINMMEWNITKDKMTERMAVSTDDAWSVPGTARQPPPEKGMPDPTTDDIEKGRWLDGFKAQDEMLDGFMKKYNLEKMDWRPAMYQDLQKNWWVDIIEARKRQEGLTKKFSFRGQALV